MPWIFMAMNMDYYISSFLSTDKRPASNTDFVSIRNSERGPIHQYSHSMDTQNTNSILLQN